MASRTNKEWSEMTADERKALTAENKARAVAACGPGKFPTGLTVTIGGKEYIARPVRVTDSGGVTYGITPRPATVGKYSARFNKFSLTLGVGENTAEASFDEEELL